MRFQNPPNKYQQDAGIKLGLSRVRVLALNFGHHMIATRALDGNNFNLVSDFLRH